MTQQAQAHDLHVVRIPEWKKYEWLRHGFSTRANGVSRVYGDSTLNLGWTKEDDPTAVAENRRRFVHAIDGDHTPSALVTLRQVHSATVHVVKEEDGALEGKLQSRRGKGSPRRRRLHDEPARNFAGRGDCGLRSRPGYRCGKTSRGCVSCGMERHSGTDRRARYRNHAAGVWIAHGRSGGSHRTRHWRLLLHRWRGGQAIFRRTFPLREGSLQRAKRRPTSSSIYGRPTGSSYWNRESRIRRSQSSVSAPLARGTKEGNYNIFRIAGNMESLDEC